jgi:hypothetical protein
LLWFGLVGGWAGGGDHFFRGVSVGLMCLLHIKFLLTAQSHIPLSPPKQSTIPPPKPAPKG